MGIFRNGHNPVKYSDATDPSCFDGNARKVNLDVHEIFP